MHYASYCQSTEVGLGGGAQAACQNSCRRGWKQEAAHCAARVERHQRRHVAQLRGGDAAERPPGGAYVGVPVAPQGAKHIRPMGPDMATAAAISVHSGCQPCRQCSAWCGSNRSAAVPCRFKFLRSRAQGVRVDNKYAHQRHQPGICGRVIRKPAAQQHASAVCSVHHLSAVPVLF